MESLTLLLHDCHRFNTAERYMYLSIQPFICKVTRQAHVYCTAIQEDGMNEFVGLNAFFLLFAYHLFIHPFHS